MELAGGRVHRFGVAVYRPSSFVLRIGNSNGCRTRLDHLAVQLHLIMEGKNPTIEDILGSRTMNMNTFPTVHTCLLYDPPFSDILGETIPDGDLRRGALGTREE